MAYYGSFGLTERKELKKKRKKYIPAQAQKKKKVKSNLAWSPVIFITKQETGQEQEHELLVQKQWCPQDGSTWEKCPFSPGQKPFILLLSGRLPAFLPCSLLQYPVQDRKAMFWAPLVFHLFWLVDLTDLHEDKYTRIKPTDNRSFVSHFTRTSQSTDSQDSMNHRLKQKYCWLVLFARRGVSLSHLLKPGTTPESCYSSRHLQHSTWQNTPLVCVREDDYFL